jgi:hypothetical protein
MVAQEAPDEACTSDASDSIRLATEATHSSEPGGDSAMVQLYMAVRTVVAIMDIRPSPESRYRSCTTEDNMFIHRKGCEKVTITKKIAAQQKRGGGGAGVGMLRGRRNAPPFRKLNA